MRELIRGAGLAEPDEVLYHPDELLLVWHEAKLVVTVELDAPQTD